MDVKYLKRVICNFVTEIIEMPQYDRTEIALPEVTWPISVKAKRPDAEDSFLEEYCN